MIEWVILQEDEDIHEYKCMQHVHILNTSQDIIS